MTKKHIVNLSDNTATDIDLTETELTARQSEIDAWNAKADERAMAQLRSERDRLLTETDYLALSDTTLTTAMTTYRQALRDLPATYVNNPSEVVYPTKP